MLNGHRGINHPVLNLETGKGEITSQNHGFAINKEETKRRMKEVLADIQSGKFTKQWMDECKNGQKNFLKTREELAKHSIETVGTKLRAMMPWIGKKKLVDSDKK